MNFDSPEFSISQVAAAARIALGTASVWTARHPELAGEIVETEAGPVVRYSAHHILQMRIMTELARYGMAAKQSAPVSWSFVHTNTGADRRPGEPFRDGRTWLLVLGGDRVEIIHMPPGQNLPPWDFVNDVSVSILAVDMNALFEEVMRSLETMPVVRRGRPPKQREES